MRSKEINIHLIPTGGIGNQFFQYSFARWINSNIPGSHLIIDKSTYRKYKLRSFILDQYHLDQDVVISESSLSFYWRFKYHLFRGIHRLLFKLTPRKKDGLKHFSHKLFTFFANRGWIICLDSDFHKLNLSKINKRKKIIVFGYFQCIEYFYSIKDIVRKEFEPKNKLSETAMLFLKKIKENTNGSLALSFRCSDYKKLGYFIEDLQPGYTIEINRMIATKYSEYEKIFFTEDIESSRNYITNLDSFLPHAKCEYYQHKLDNLHRRYDNLGICLTCNRQSWIR